MRRRPAELGGGGLRPSGLDRADRDAGHLDPGLRLRSAQEEAAYDLGANRWQAFREVTLPALWPPGLFSGALFAFLLSWGNFPLSTFTTGADSTVTEWLYTKMGSGYTPMIPTMGALSVFGAIVILFGGYMFLIVQRRRRLERGE